MSQVSNVSTDHIERMNIKDSFRVLDYLIKEFPKAGKIFINNFIEFEDAKNEKMLNVAFVAQVFSGLNQEQAKYKFEFCRAKDFCVINGIQKFKLDDSEFDAELKFMFRYNSMTRK